MCDPQLESNEKLNLHGTAYYVKYSSFMFGV